LNVGVRLVSAINCRSVKRTTFRNMKPYCSFGAHPRFEEAYYFYLQGARSTKKAEFACYLRSSAYFSILKKEVVRTFETSVSFY
jgi:hypothetical protein